MTPVMRETDNESKKAIEDYLAKGGKITQCPPNARTEEIGFKGGFYAKRRKKKEEEASKK